MIGIFDGGGNGVVLYNWDNAWGYHPQPEGPMADTLGTLNPLRYRSYVYDQETGLYYLQSRYYDPEISRFINADNFISTGQGLLGNNMFAYCRNNPVYRKDIAGTWDVCTKDSTDDNNPLNDIGGVYHGGAGGGSIWTSFTRTLKYAADGLKQASGQRDLTHVEDHHLIPYKHSTKTSEYKEIADRYNYSLDHKSNHLQLQGHRGRHTNAYHDFITVAIKELDAIAAGSTAVFIEGMGVLGEFIKVNWWLPYGRYK